MDAKSISSGRPIHTCSIFPFLLIIRVMFLLSSLVIADKVLPSSRVIISLGGIFLLESLDRFFRALFFNPFILPSIFSMS